MPRVVGFKPFPWHCRICRSPQIRLNPTNRPEDPQEIDVTCEACGHIWVVTGEPFFVDRDEIACERKAKQMADEVPTGAHGIKYVPNEDGTHRVVGYLVIKLVIDTEQTDVTEDDIVSEVTRMCEYSVSYDGDMGRLSRTEVVDSFSDPELLP